jgi:hypothetical protein
VSQLLLLGDFCPSSGLEEASVYFLLGFLMIVLLIGPVTPTLFICECTIDYHFEKGGDGFFIPLLFHNAIPNPKNSMSVDFGFPAGSNTKNPFI